MKRTLALYFLSALGLSGCHDALAERKREILGSLGRDEIAPHYDWLAEHTSELELWTGEYAEYRPAEDFDETALLLGAAQSAWEGTMVVWEGAEMMQFGPGMPELRDEMYSFPAIDTCRIDEATVAGRFADVDAFAAQPASIRGLAAIEYLLFADSTENTCPASASINMDGSWAGLGPHGVTRARARYAHTLAVLVNRTAIQLRDAWDPYEADFVPRELARAGNGSTVYPTAQDALEDLLRAMSYIDTWTTERKLGQPAGLAACSSAPCASTFESPYAHESTALLRANVHEFRNLFLGRDVGRDPGLGIDDLLVDAGSEETAMRMVSALDAAELAIESLPGSLEDAVENHPNVVRAIYDALSSVATLFELDVFRALDAQYVGPSED